MIRFTKNIFIGLLIAAVLIGGYLIFGRQKRQPVYNFVIAGRGDVTQEVSVTGRVKPVEKVDLAFEKSGKVSKIYVNIGDRVTAGQTLVVLNNADIEAQLLQAEAEVESAKSLLTQQEAALLSQEAKLNEAKRGTRTEELQIAETNVANAQKSLADAQTSLKNAKQTADISLSNLYGKVKDILNDAYAKSDNAINTQTANMFSNASSDSPKLTFSTTDSQAKIDSEFQRALAGNSLLALKADVDNLSSSYQAIDNLLTDSQNQLIIMRTFLARLNTAVNYASGLSSTTLDAYKTSVTAAWTNVNTAIANINNQAQLIASQKATNQSNIDTAQSAVNTAQNTLSSAQDSLALKKAGSAPEQIASQEAQVKQAEANVASQKAQIKSAEANVKNIQAQLAKTIILSPIAGVVTRQDVKIGEIVSANNSLVSLISDAKFQIEANVPEADIAKVKTGDEAKVTLDAYGSDVIFVAKVISIDPAEIMIEGVATYKTTLEFIKEDDSIRSGMTANIDILTAKRENTIFVPSRAIISRAGEKYLWTETAKGEIKERKIQTGLKGSDGNTEIVSGVTEGEKIILNYGAY